MTAWFEATRTSSLCSFSSFSSTWAKTTLQSWTIRWLSPGGNFDWRHYWGLFFWNHLTSQTDVKARTPKLSLQIFPRHVWMRNLFFRYFVWVQIQSLPFCFETTKRMYCSVKDRPCWTPFFLAILHLIFSKTSHIIIKTKPFYTTFYYSETKKL